MSDDDGPSQMIQTDIALFRVTTLEIHREISYDNSENEASVVPLFAPQMLYL
jgi:hypothetical protein